MQAIPRCHTTPTVLRKEAQTIPKRCRKASRDLFCFEWQSAKAGVSSAPHHVASSCTEGLAEGCGHLGVIKGLK